jgi:hypothetical protein
MEFTRISKYILKLGAMCVDKTALRLLPGKVTVGSIMPEKITVNIWFSHCCE